MQEGLSHPGSGLGFPRMLINDTICDFHWLSFGMCRMRIDQTGILPDMRDAQWWHRGLYVPIATHRICAQCTPWLESRSGPILILLFQQNKYHLSHSLGYKNGYATQKRPEVGIGGKPIEYNQLNQSDLDHLANFNPTLTYGQAKQAPPEDFIPGHVAWDKKVFVAALFPFLSSSLYYSLGCVSSGWLSVWMLLGDVGDTVVHKQHDTAMMEMRVGLFITSRDKVMMHMSQQLQ